MRLGRSGDSAIEWRVSLAESHDRTFNFEVQLLKDRHASLYGGGEVHYRFSCDERPIVGSQLLDANSRSSARFSLHLHGPPGTEHRLRIEVLGTSTTTLRVGTAVLE